MRLAVLIFVGFNGINHEETETCLLKKRLVMQNNIVPDLISLEDMPELVNKVKMEPKNTVFMEGVVILQGELHQGEQQ
jgi:hypothetical protein